jgi:hypothetical protein
MPTSIWPQTCYLEAASVPRRCRAFRIKSLARKILVCRCDVNMFSSDFSIAERIYNLTY